MVMLSEMGMPVKYGHSEVGYIQPEEEDARIWEQHEIEMQLQPLTQAADAVLLTQWVLRNLAHKSGWRVQLRADRAAGSCRQRSAFPLSPVIEGVNHDHRHEDGTARRREHAG